ncbi:hypothetical protein EV401DRAFT_2049283 [Pisolithus croceorrhizus]|nr:hypothetical protein EV401DRAFT_2049283 [Pisolithus croceorrhizus]
MNEVARLVPHDPLYASAAMVTLLAIVISRLKMPPIISSPCRRAFETLPHYSPFFWAPPIIIKPILCVLVLRKARGLLRARTGLSALLARGRFKAQYVFFLEQGFCGSIIYPGTMAY